MKRLLPLLPLLLSACAATSPLDAAGTDPPDDPVDDPAGPTPELLIITVPALLEGAETYAAYRESTGYAVHLLATDDLVAEDSTLVEAIRDQIAAFATSDPAGARRSVLLLGDAVDGVYDDPDTIPLAPGDGAHGDHPYADLDGDGVPDIAIGRLPFSDPQPLADYLARLERFEAAPHVGAANRDVRLFAGESGFGEAVDQAIEVVAGSIVDELSYDFDLEVTYNLSSSPFYLPDEAWYDEFTGGYREGSLFQPYIGHTLGWLPVEDLAGAKRPGLLAFLSCSDGAIQYPQEPSLAEEVLAMPDGALAVIGATQVSQPCANAVMAREIGSALMNDRVPTAGELMLTTMEGVRYREDELRALIAGLCDAFSEETMEEMIASHLAMYLLLGDPTVRLGAPPGEIEFDVGLALPAGETVTVAGTVWTDDGRSNPMDLGEIVVTLETDRATIVGEILDPDGTPDTHVLNHATANDHVLAHVSGPVDDGAFEVLLEIPLDAEQGDTYLKAYASHAGGDAVGSVRIGIGS